MRTVSTSIMHAVEVLTTLALAIGALVHTVSPWYRESQDAALKTAVYLTAPMRAILRAEQRSHRNLVNVPIDFLSDGGSMQSVQCGDAAMKDDHVVTRVLEQVPHRGSQVIVVVDDHHATRVSRERPGRRDRDSQRSRWRPFEPRKPSPIWNSNIEAL